MNTPCHEVIPNSQRSSGWTDMHYQCPSWPKGLHTPSLSTDRAASLTEIYWYMREQRDSDTVIGAVAFREVEINNQSVLARGALQDCP